MRDRERFTFSRVGFLSIKIWSFKEALFFVLVVVGLLKLETSAANLFTIVIHDSRVILTRKYDSWVVEHNAWGMSPRQRTLTNFVRGRSITVRMTSCLTGLDSTKLLNFYLIQHKQSSRILNSQTGGHPYSDASPYVLSECSLPWIGHCLYKKTFESRWLLWLGKSG